MKIVRDLKHHAVTIRFETSFTLRDAIGLPRLIARVPHSATVVLDFSDVRWMRDSALAALIPALASIHGRHLTVQGLECLELERLQLMPLAA